MADVRWRALLPALIISPLVPAAIGAGVLFLASLTGGEAVAPTIIAAAAIYGAMLGAPTYLIFGGIAFWLTIRRARGNPRGFWFWALIANLISAPFVLMFFMVLPGGDPFGPTGALIGFGCIFAPVWGGLFGMFHRWFGGLL